MKSLASALLSLVAALTLSPTPTQVSPADLVLTNGNIYTVNVRQPKANALAIRGDKIVFVGSNIAARRYVGNKTRVIDLKGQTVVPGMTDSHQHLAGVGFREMTLNLEGVASLEDFLNRIKVRIEQAKPGEWVVGRGWIETFWKPPAFPTRSQLDAVAPNNPVILTRADGHASVVNSAALKIGGVDRNTANPFGGEISKDAAGEPNGMLIDAAQGLVRRHIPPTSAAEAERAIALGVKRNIELGWTQIQDAGGSYAEVELFRKLYGEGKIKLRIYKAVHGPGPSATRLLAAGGSSVGEFGHRFNARTIKVVADGALGSRGAALAKPYSDSPSTSGFLTVKQEELAPMLEAALKNGIQVETHAIGDRANRFTLDEYEKAFRAVPRAQRKIPDPRWRVEHAQVIDPIDIPRFAKLGVIPSMQPSHAIGDLHFAPSRVGIQRLAGAYAWKSLIKSGAIIPGGSDAPVERGEPMIEFYAAVARKDMKGFSGDGWHPEEAVSRDEALKMFTIWPAFAAFEEKLRGSIEVGKLADLSIFSADIMRIPEAEILNTRCVMTVIGGEVVYEAP